jgi:hypothetical protein
MRAELTMVSSVTWPSGRCSTQGQDRRRRGPLRGRPQDGPTLARAFSTDGLGALPIAAQARSLSHQITRRLKRASCRPDERIPRGVPHHFDNSGREPARNVDGIAPSVANARRPATLSATAPGCRDGARPRF